MKIATVYDEMINTEDCFNPSKIPAEMPASKKNNEQMMNEFERGLLSQVFQAMQLDM